MRSILEWKENLSLKIYPNPFNESTTLEIKDSGKGIKDLEMKIYDVFGREAARSVIPSGARNLIIKRNNLQSGIYFYKIISLSEEGSGKILASGKLCIK